MAGTFQGPAPDLAGIYPCEVPVKSLSGPCEVPVRSLLFNIKTTGDPPAAPAFPGPYIMAEKRVFCHLAGPFPDAKKPIQTSFSKI